MCNGDSIAGLIKSIITTSKRHFIMAGVLSLLGKGILSHTLRIQGWSSLGQNKDQESAREVTRAHSPILPSGGGGVDCRGNEGLYLRLTEYRAKLLLPCSISNSLLMFPNLI